MTKLATEIKESLDRKSVIRPKTITLYRREIQKLGKISYDYFSPSQ